MGQGAEARLGVPAHSYGLFLRKLKWRKRPFALTPQSRQLKSKTPLKRSSRRAVSRSRGRSVLIRWTAIGALAVVVFLAWAVLARVFAPKGNTTVAHFDAIIVLGYPADNDGNPTPEQLARVSEGVHEYERGVAPRLIMTGGAAHNNIVEAESMA